MADSSLIQVRENSRPVLLKLGHADVFNPTQKEIIDTVLDFYGDRGLPWLCQLAHLEDPWKAARNGCPLGEPCHNVISKGLMKRYYAALSASAEGNRSGDEYGAKR